MRFPKPERRSAKAPKRIARKVRVRKQRKSTLAGLKRKFWSLFSAYVKERDGNWCRSCGAKDLEGRNWQAGHLFPAQGPKLIVWDPKNVHSQCYVCNCHLGGNGAAYATWFIDHYGTSEFLRLSDRSRLQKQWKAHEVQELIAALEKGPHYYESLYAEKYGL